MWTAFKTNFLTNNNFNTKVKTQTIKHTALMLTIGVLMISACKKDDKSSNGGTTPPPPAGSRQIAKIEESTGAYSTFDYNADGLISKIESKENGEITDVTLTYSPLKKLISAAIADGSMNYIYDGSQLRRVDFISKTDNTVVGYTKFTYQNTKLSETVQYVKYQGNDIAYMKTTYAYNGSDVATQKIYAWSAITNTYELSETHNYEYDSKTNPLAATSELGQTFFQLNSVHNPVKETVYNAQNILTETDSYAYSYDNGYPSAADKTVAVPGSANVTTHITYTYKN